MVKWSEARSNGFVAQLFNERFGVQLEPIPRSIVHGAKTPDFRVGPESEPTLICEVKTFIEDENWPPADGKLHSRVDNGPARVGRAIGEAHDQLVLHSAPRVLVLHNTTRWLDAGDLDDAFRGFRPYGTADGSFSYIEVSARKVAFGEIREKKVAIDFYVWIEHTAPDVKLFFRAHSQKGKDVAQTYFAIPQSKWKPV